MPPPASRNVLSALVKTCELSVALSAFAPSVRTFSVRAVVGGRAAAWRSGHGRPASPSSLLIACFTGAAFRAHTLPPAVAPAEPPPAQVANSPEVVAAPGPRPPANARAVTATAVLLCPSQSQLLMSADEHTQSLAKTSTTVSSSHTCSCSTPLAGRENGASRTVCSRKPWSNIVLFTLDWRVSMNTAVELTPT